MTENMQVAIAAINKWVYFSLNYDVVPYTYNHPNGEVITVYIPDFLVGVNWTCHISHMIAKWQCAAKTKDAHAYLIRFYTELDSQNQKLLLEWVVSNYNGERKLSY